MLISYLIHYSTVDLKKKGIGKNETIKQQLTISFLYHLNLTSLWF